MNSVENHARVSMISLGVNHLKKSTKFYEMLGWEKSEQSQDTISFMKGVNIVLGLYGINELAMDSGIRKEARGLDAGFSGIALALNLPSKDSVDEYARRAIKAGATITKQPQEVFWGGYSGYFADLDGHLWEIAYNPFFEFDADGNLDI